VALALDPPKPPRRLQVTLRVCFKPILLSGEGQFEVHVAIITITLARFNILRSYYRKGSMATTGAGTGFLESISPWASRSTTPKPVDGREKDAETGKLSNQKGADHTISHRHRLTLKEYPSDCPKANIRWFNAVDVSTRFLMLSTFYNV